MKKIYTLNAFSLLLFLVFNNTANSQTITTLSLPSSRYCVGDTIVVSFTTTGAFNPGNSFTVWLSDSTGDFTVPYFIASAAVSPVKIKLSPPSKGNNFRVKVVSSDPYIIGTDNGAGFSIQTFQYLSVTSTPPNSCNQSKQVFRIDNHTGISINSINWQFTGAGGDPEKRKGVINNVKFPLKLGAYFYTGPNSLIITTNDTSHCPISLRYQWASVNCLPGHDPSIAFLDEMKDSTLCACGNYNIPFGVIKSTDTVITYTVWLSDPHGSFVVPTTIGTLKSNMPYGNIPVVIPCNTIPANHYQIAIDASGGGVIANSINDFFITIENANSTSVSISTSDTLICTGTIASFTAVPANAGANPAFQWLVNGISTNSGITFSSDALQNNDIVTCQMTSSSNVCGSLYASDSVMITVLPACESHFETFADSVASHLWYVQLDTPLCGQAVSYLWNWGDGSSSTDLAPVHVYTDAGKYNICLSITNVSGCIGTYCDSANVYRTDGEPVTVKVVVPGYLSTGGDEQPGKQGVFIFPNPLPEDAMLSVKSEEVINEIIITNTIGQVVNVLRPVIEKNTTLQLPQAPGLYFIHIKAEKGEYVRKVVRE